jgi:hypothetical protein
LDTIASDYGWSDLPDDDGHKPEDDADVTLNNTAKDIINLPDTPSVAGLYANGTYLGYHDGSAWKAYIQNNGYFYFNGDANNYIQWNGSNLSIKGTLTITGGSGIANLTDAGNLATLDSVGASNLNTTVISGGKIITGLLTATNIRTGYLRTVQFRCGGGTDEDIYFEDSGIHMYDVGDYTIRLYKSNYKYLGFGMTSNTGTLKTDGYLSLVGVGQVTIGIGGGLGYAFSDGVIALPNLSTSSPPSAITGGICMMDNHLYYYDGSVWKPC